MPCPTRRRIAGRAESRSVEVMMGGAAVVVVVSSSDRLVSRQGCRLAGRQAAGWSAGQRSVALSVITNIIIINFFT